MSRARNSRARSGRQPESLPPRLPEDVCNTRMRDLLELEPPPSDEELDRYWSTALKRLWHGRFRGEAGYTDELVPNLKRCIKTRTLDSPNLTDDVAVDLVPEWPLSLILSATMRTPYSQTKVKAAVDKWSPKWETAEEQEEEEDGVQIASSKASGISAGGMQPSTSLVKSKTTTSSLRRGIRRPDYVIEVGCSHIAGSESTSVPLTIEIKAFPLSDSGHPQSELEADKAFVRGLSQTAMYALAGWEMFRYRRGLFICGPTFSRVFVLDDNALAVEVASPPASLSALSVSSFFSSYNYDSMPHSLIFPLVNERGVSSPLLRYGPRYTINPLSCRLLERVIRGVVERTLGQTVGEALGCQTEDMNFDSLSASYPGIALGILIPSYIPLDLVKHARHSATISKAANSGTGRKKKVSCRKSPYLEARGNRKDRGGGGGGSGRSGRDGRDGRSGRGDRSGWGGKRRQNRGGSGVDASEKRGGDGGTGSGACDEGDEDTGIERSHDLSADNDRDRFIDAPRASLEAEGVEWKGSGCLTKADRCNRLNNWLEALPQAEKPIDIPSNGVSPSTPAVEDVLAHLAMDSIEYQELRIATVLGDLGVHFMSVSSAQMDELFSANPSVCSFPRILHQ
ncbi:hypothetical protein I306_03638 [Cryptococcus gattii EJB2]|uniref:Fungal-type protein kinase domain-containing protein n=1 Tax=Cryptococcus gattii EJB2 TaxID=1296103 RepID=A0ABR5BUD6_9TREE|nr:hypothetical protein I306_03638 [Cryptococcus gattii EJB2]